MLVQKPSVQVIEHGGIEARIYQVQQGYRVEVSGLDTEFYWGILAFLGVSKNSGTG
ncbi:MAG TPA: hypothetical protein V6D30_12305 [Leptolyngbyaceae cyanobacterium]